LPFERITGILNRYLSTALSKRHRGTKLPLILPSPQWGEEIAPCGGKVHRGGGEGRREP